MCEANPLTTIVSVDGVSAHDTITREAMMHGLMGMESGECLLPFVRQFCGRVSQHLWEDAEGVTHTISQSEGGEQGDPLMPIAVWGNTAHWKQSTEVSVQEKR